MELNVPSILLWGLFATGVLTLIMSASQGIGWSRISFPFMLGTIFSGHRSRAMVVGFAAHLVAGVLFAVLYALVFESWGRAVWWTGALLGLYHGLFVLVVIASYLPTVHPRMAGRHHGPSPTRHLEPPGFMAINYGRRTPVVTLIAHVFYGGLLGAFYTLA